MSGTASNTVASRLPIPVLEATRSLKSELLTEDSLGPAALELGRHKEGQVPWRGLRGDEGFLNRTTAFPGAPGWPLALWKLTLWAAKLTVACSMRAGPPRRRAS